jgi:hypothetical protein
LVWLDTDLKPLSTTFETNTLTIAPLIRFKTASTRRTKIKGIPSSFHRKGRVDYLRIYKLECILLHNTFSSTTVFSFYIFTFLMFSKLLNQPQLTKIKQQNFMGIHAFDSRLYLDISRSFLCPKSSPIKWKHCCRWKCIM